MLRLTSEHSGSRGRILTGPDVRGVFVNKTAYVTDDADPGSFMKCGLRRGDGSLRTFDNYSTGLRAAARAKRVSREKDAFVVADLFGKKAKNRTRGKFTISGGRVKTMTLRTQSAGPELSPQTEVVFTFDYGHVPLITAPPADTVESAPAC